MPVWDKDAYNTYYAFPAEPWGRPADRPVIYLHYHHFFMSRYDWHYAPLLMQVCGIKAGDNIVVLGSGFNWTGEGLSKLGMNVIGTDTSAFILANRNQTEEAEIRECIAAVGLDPDTARIEDTGFTRQAGVAGKLFLDVYLHGGLANPSKRARTLVMGEDMATSRSRTAIAKQLGGAPNFLLTEEVLNSVDDATALQICDYAENFMRSKGAQDYKVIHILSPLQDPKHQRQELNWKSYADWRTFLDVNGFTTHKIMPSVTWGDVREYGGLL